MAKILVGTPSVDPDSRFLGSLPLFLYEISKVHNVVHKFVCNKQIYEAHSELAEQAVDENYDYLLMVEDDHWGFTPQMLFDLIQSDKEVCGIPYYSRHAIYLMTTMRYAVERDDDSKGNMSTYHEVHSGEGFEEVDLIGFGFTLFKTKTLSKMSRPWFRPTGAQSNATDKFFAKKLSKELGIKPYGCFDYVLPHRDITKENVQEFRIKFMKDRRSYELLGRLDEWKRRKLAEDTDPSKGKSRVAVS